MKIPVREDETMKFETIKDLPKLTRKSKYDFIYQPLDEQLQETDDWIVIAVPAEINISEFATVIRMRFRATSKHPKIQVSQNRQAKYIYVRKKKFRQAKTKDSK